MARLTGEFKRGSLRTLYRACAASAVTLGNALDAFQDAGFAAVQSGRIVVMSSSAGRTVNFAPPQVWQTLSQEEVFCLSEELQAVYTDAKANLTAQGNATPTDDQVFAGMMADDRLATITEVRNDYTGLRFPNRFA